ncbi:hypothetical protein ACRYCC_41240 [Actinomadura scrupuli]|uniref:hypothetical protein n=1 Tax=Actinomadura scrupuli TaxID=559629 RepID=UPI003D99F417
MTTSTSKVLVEASRLHENGVRIWCALEAAADLHSTSSDRRDVHARAQAALARYLRRGAARDGGRQGEPGEDPEAVIERWLTRDEPSLAERVAALRGAAMVPEAVD